LTIRVREAETYSDEVLMGKIQQWLKEHKNEINIFEFSKIFRVSETRVEQILNKMVNEGVLEVRK
jgi:Fic family protein